MTVSLWFMQQIYHFFMITQNCVTQICVTQTCVIVNLLLLTRYRVFDTFFYSQITCEGRPFWVDIYLALQSSGATSL